MKKAAIFIDTIREKGLPEEKKFEILGDNTGNMLFWHALIQLLDLDVVPRNTIEEDKERLDSYSSFITTDLIWIGQDVDFSYMRSFLDAIGDKPLIPISVGLQHSHFDPDFKLHTNTAAILKELSERCVLGVRGYYTAEILNKYRITNIDVIGCPSLYYNSSVLKKIKNSPKSIEKVCLNFETFFHNLTDPKLDFLLFGAQNNYSFVEQTKYRLTLEQCNNKIEIYNYLKLWLDKETRIFFDIDEWREFARKFDFSIGYRFHGNVISLWEGIPALFITCDSRTKELCETFALPTLDFNDFDINHSIEHYYNLADYSEFAKKYAERLKKFIDFSHKNGLKVHFGNDEKSESRNSLGSLLSFF